MQQYTLKLAHLYPKELNLYGDFGNILSLNYICQKRNIKLEYHPINVGEEVDLASFDFFFMGGGQDHEQNAIIDHFLYNLGDKLLVELDNKKVFLGICGAFQLLGQKFITKENKLIKGLGYFPLETIATETRLVGDLITETDFLSGENKYLIGFENHSGHTQMLSSFMCQTKGLPLGKVLQGVGNNLKDGTEGWRKNNAIGTYCHGSFLPKNPAMTNYLLNEALKLKYQKEFTEIYIDERAKKLRERWLSKKLGAKYER